MMGRGGRGVEKTGNSQNLITLMEDTGGRGKA